jgi:hypothetical protein
MKFNAILALSAVAVAGWTADHANASLPKNIDGGALLTSLAPAPNGGFWAQVDPWFGSYLGGTFSKEGAPEHSPVLTRGNIVAVPKEEGFWVVTDTGKVYARGDAPPLCTESSEHPVGDLSLCGGFPKYPFSLQFIVGAAATATGKGLWALGRDGRLWAVGDAVSYGDVTAHTRGGIGNLNLVPTGIAATPSGKGYYIVMEDGGVFSFGDAVFHGSTGGKKPGGHTITGIALNLNESTAVTGYWLLGEDGAVYTFGNAPFLGNGGIDPLGRNATSLVSFPISGPTQGYAWVREDGTVSFVTKPSNPTSGPMPGLPHPLPNS